MSQNDPPTPNYDEPISFHTDYNIGTFDSSGSGVYRYGDTNQWTIYTTPASPDTMEVTLPIPPELMVCVVCGVEDVLIFCDACKDVIREARKKWAEDFLEEIENALS